MTSAVEAVDLYLKQDPTLADTVSRGLANIRKTARWMIEENGWDVTEDAVVSALRRYNERNPQQPFARPRRSLEEGQVELKTGLALLEMPRTHDVQEDALNAWKAADVRDTLGVLPSRTTLKILIEESSLSGFRAKMGRGRVEEITSPVSLLEVKFGGGSPAPAMVVLLVSALVHHKVEIVEVMSCSPSFSMAVPAAHGRMAFDILSKLTE